MFICIAATTVWEKIKYYITKTDHYFHGRIKERQVCGVNPPLPTFLGWIIGGQTTL